MVGTIELTLTRDQPGPWGLRLQGGVDFERALTVVVTEGSPSFNSGLRTGDVIIGLKGLEASLLTHKQAQDAIISQGNSVKMTVQRNSLPSQPQPGTWKPDVQLVGGPATQPGGQNQTYTKTSLALDPKPQEEHWDVRHNITAKGFQAASPPNAAAAFQSVAAPSGSPAAASGPAGFRSISAPVTKPGAAASGGQPNGPPSPPVCYLCSKPISGVFLQVKGRPIMEECFKCTACQCTLKNVGHFVIGDKLYCQVHARDAQNQLHGLENGGGTMPPSAPKGQGLPQGLAGNLAKLSLQPKTLPAAPPPTAAAAVNPPPPPFSANSAFPAPPSFCGVGSGPALPPGGVGSGPNGHPPPPSDWSNKLDSDKAGMASNAEDFTKEFMKQLAGGSNF